MRTGNLARVINCVLYKVMLGLSQHGWLQVAPDRFADIKSALVSICSSSTRSSKPAIYGIAAEAEIRLLRPLSSIEVRMTHHVLLRA